MMSNLNFKLNYSTRRRLINLLDQFNEFVLIKKLECKDLNVDQYELIKKETNSLIDKINELELINDNKYKKRKLTNDVIYLDIDNNLQERIIKILSNNKKFCLTKNLELIISENDKIKQIIDDNLKLINDLFNLNDFNFNSIFIKQQNQINTSSNLNDQNQSANLINQVNTSSNLNEQIQSANLINQVNTSSNLNQSANTNIFGFNPINKSSSFNFENQSANTNIFDLNPINTSSNFNFNQNQSANTNIFDFNQINKSDNDLDQNMNSESNSTSENSIIEIIYDNQFNDQSNKQSNDLSMDDDNEITESNNNEILESNDNAITESNNNLNRATESNNSLRSNDCEAFNLNENKLDELIIINPKNLYDVDLNWFGTNNLINLTNTRISWDSIYLTTELIKAPSNLKYLKISMLIDTENFDLNILNVFKKLEQLDIYFLFNLKDDVQLDLDQLKIIQIEHQPEIKNKITIKSLQLKYIQVDNLKIIDIVNKSSIEFIETYFLDKIIYEFYNLQIINLDQSFYKNLDSVIIDNEQLNSIMNIKITKLINLKKINLIILQLTPNNYKSNRTHNYNYSEIKMIFEKWLNERENENLKFYFSNLMINNLGYLELILNKLSEFKDDDNKMRLFYENIIKLEENYNYLYKINFNILINYFNDNQFKDIFFQKFTNIRIIKANNEINNSDIFLEFIKKLDKLYEIELYQTHLKQEFYIKLSKLNKLILNFTLIETKIKLDYQFLFYFKLLQNLKLSQNLNFKFLNFATNLMSKLEILSTIEFGFDNKTIELNRLDKNLYECKVFKDDSSKYYINKKFNDFKELNNHLKKKLN